MFFLTCDDIGNIERRLKDAQYMFDKNDAQSVHIWKDINPNKIFYYLEFEDAIDDDGTHSLHFRHSTTTTTRMDEKICSR